jgi:hypothetical protein
MNAEGNLAIGSRGFFEKLIGKLGKLSFRI